MLVQRGMINSEEVDQILEYQNKHRLMFGEAAVRSKRIKRKEVEHALAQQFTGPTPQPNEFSPELVAAYQPTSPFVEALRVQRSLLLQHWFSTQSRLLSIVSPNSGDGRSFYAANLAVLFAQLGRETLLIDADLRRPRQHEIFRMDNATGLSTVLAGRSHSERIYRFSNLSNLAVLPAGPFPPNPLELLSRDRFGALLATLSHRFQVVIVDTPAGSEHADAQMVAPRTGGALMLMRAEQTRLAQAHGMVQRLAHVNVKVIGAVLNRI
jgi:receptor protein-tyrosine kinase